MRIPIIANALLAAWALMLPSTLHAAHGFPDYLKFPPQIVVDPDQSLLQQDLGEAEFPSGPGEAPLVTRRGKHYQRWLRYAQAAGEPAPGYDNGSEQRIAQATGSALTAAGWRLIVRDPSGSPAVFALTAGGHEAWLQIKMDAPTGAVNYELVELAGVVTTLAHRVPAATPETIAPDMDFPYLTPFPGATRTYAGHADGPLDVSLAFAASNGGEPVLVGQGVEARNYQGPPGLSALQFVRDQRLALSAAGWQVLLPAREQDDASTGIVIAHYAKGKRDLWVRLGYQDSATLSYLVTDLGTTDWVGIYERECRIPLYGVLFDFNQATLKPESASVLSRAQALLAARGAEPVEIQGHTDNVGSDAANLSLSKARAQAVRGWLVDHGIAASRLTTVGYGETQPRASNDDDAGRAQNRRVELARKGCE